MDSYLNTIAEDDKIKLDDDFELLDIMLNDSKKQPPLYHPGAYWASKAKNSAKEIKRCGIADIRGSTNLVGLSYADNLITDYRFSLNHGFKKRLVRMLLNIYPFNMIFDAQVQWTKSYAKRSIFYAQEMLKLKEETIHLLEKYTMPYSLLGGCLDKARINEQDISVYYLELLTWHDHFASRIPFNDAVSIFEIGGGFGANIHILLENYKNIRKVLYLDIAPNLYVGTQYLRAFYGNAVVDYKDLRGQESIKFSANNDLEILCITPWQIEKIEGEIDIFMNSNSFVEMPKSVVKNYVGNFKRLPNSKDSAVVLSTYRDFDPNTTLNPYDLATIFEDRKFEIFEAESFINSNKNIIFTSPGKLSFK